MTKIPFFFLLLLLCFTLFSPSSAVQRHLLHQPFFPVPVTSTASPPSPAPSPNSHHHHQHYHYHKNHPPPPPPEKHTFSSVSTPPPSPPHHNPFFPSSDPSSPTSSHSPPSPPPPASLPTFPANISSLLFPTHTSPTKPHHTRLITITASVISAASLLSLLTLFIIFLRRSRHSPIDDTKSIRSDSLQLFNGAPSDGLSKHKQPPKYTSSNTSSEFLYLGTLVNSTSTGLDQTQKSPVSNTTGVLELPAPASSSSSSSYSQYHHNNKIGSPELRPLPPLPKLPSFSPRFQSSEQLNPKRDHHFDGDDIENDEFFSPRGSSGRKLSPPRVKDSGSNSSSPSNSVSSLNDSPVVKLSSPPLKRVCPVRPPPPPPLPPHPLQFSVTSAATSDVEKLEEKKEESLKPKLKALHWDKVRASSSRATVWDQIKSNSFQ